jgi:hypothetical protein
MRSICRSFLAAILLTAAAGAALAQDAGAVPPPSSPPVVKPVAELPAIPFAKSPAPAVEPALTADQTAPAAAPVASVAVAPSATEKPVATTGKRVTKTSARKPAAKPLVQVSQSFESVAPAAGVAVDASANVPPPDAPAKAAPPEASAPPPPAAKPAVVESRSEATKSQRTMGVGGWVLFGIVVVGLFLAMTAIRRRRTQTQRSPSIVDFTTTPSELAPALVPRR